MTRVKPTGVATASTSSRRQFLRRGAVGLGAAGLGALSYTWRVEPHWIELAERRMPLTGLPAEMRGKRLVQISDLHIGPVVDRSYIAAAVERTAELRPDVIVITGDLMTCEGNEQVDQAAAVLESLPPTPLGRFAIMGNHDYGYQWSQAHVADELSDRLERLEIRVLRNDVADVRGLQIMGVDDFYTSRFAPASAIRRLDPARPSIALCHNPDGVDQPAMQHFRGWILAGHTHGGQCKLPWLSPPVLPVQNRRYTSGEFELSGDRRLYINRGLGYTHRLRFNCRPEITAFTLTERGAAAEGGKFALAT